MTRRTFLADLGRGTVALAVVGIAGCAAESGASASTSPTPSSTAAGGSSPGPAGSPPLLVGHGEPITSGASALVAELAAGG
jgi:hypothetical protein